MTRHLNKKHVLFQVERPQEVLKTYFLVKTKATSPPELKKKFWNVLNVILESRCFPFGEIAHYFSESLNEIYQNNCTQYKTMKTTFPKISKAVSISIRYRKTSHTQFVKSQSNERGVRKLAQPKRDSTFEQKTRIVPSRESSGISQNIIFSCNQRKKQSRAQTDNFGTYSTSFCKVGVFLSEKSPIAFRTVCAKIIKTIAHNPKRRRPRFRKNQKLFFSKYSVSQDISNASVKSQSTEHSVRKTLQPRRDSAFEQKTRIVPSRETSGSSQIIFFSYNQRKKQSRAQKDISGTYTTSFWKVSVLLKKQNLFL